MKLYVDDMRPFPEDDDYLCCRSYDEAVIKTFKDGARALNNKLFKEYLAERKMNFNNTTRLLSESGVIRREENGRRSFSVYYKGETVRAIIVNPDIVIKEGSQ